MEENTPKKKSLEDLNKEKIQVEIDLLHARLLAEYPEEGTPGFFDKLAGFASKWSTFILGTVTLISAVFGIVVPLSEYLDQQKRALEYNLNENMIAFVDDLNSEDQSIARRSIMMLSYYEINSIPILLFFLEDSRDNQKDFREKLIETIDIIYAGNSGDEIIDMILLNFEKNFSQIKDLDNMNETLIDSKRLMALYNYIELIKGMNLTRSNHEQVEIVYGQTKSTICNDAFLRDDFDMIGIISELSLFMGVEDVCE